jgi:tetratricopeptide (TPR) repeat protein
VWDKGLAYGRQAGEKALARSAHREAVEYFEQALNALSHLPEIHDTQRQAIDLRLTLRAALLASGDFGRMLAYLREAEPLAEALADPRRLGFISHSLASHFYFMGAYAQAIAVAQRALALAAASGDTALHAVVNQRLGIVYGTQGHYRRGIDYLRQTVASLEGVQRHERFDQLILPAVFSRAHLAWWYAELGMFAEGSAFGEEGIQIAGAVAHPGSLMMALWGMGLLAFRQGDLLKALSRLEQAMGICQDTALPLWFPWIAAALGAAYALGGRIADAIPLLSRAIEQTTAMEMRVMQAFCGLSLGEAHLLAGRLEEAHALAERALALARERQERGHQAHTLRLLGDIAARHEPPECEQAGDSYRQALVLAEELGMRPLQAHCHRGLGKLYAQCGCRAEARTALSAAIELYRAMDMTFWLPQAEAVLAEVV